jgi:hypothetical protein
MIYKAQPYWPFVSLNKILGQLSLVCPYPCAYLSSGTLLFAVSDAALASRSIETSRKVNHQFCGATNGVVCSAATSTRTNPPKSNATSTLSALSLGEGIANESEASE